MFGVVSYNCPDIYDFGIEWTKFSSSIEGWLKFRGKNYM